MNSSASDRSKDALDSDKGSEKTVVSLKKDDNQVKTETGSTKSTKTSKSAKTTKTSARKGSQPRKKSDGSSDYVYDPKIADKTVRPNEILKDERFFQVARTITAFAAASISEKYSLGEKIGSQELSASDKRKRQARRLRETLLELGPTFIKLGQFLSVRRDILSPEMADELAYLQDKVPPFSVVQVKEIIERDLGSPPSELFSSFDEKPVASASIGQVHRALLKDGRRVVVKVQRPNLASRFYQDLGYMRLVTRLGTTLKPGSEWENWLKLSDEFGRNLFSEINYLQEGKNADRIRQILKDNPDIRVPRVIWKYTGKRVLTLEYIPGIKVDKIEELRNSGLDLTSIGNKLVAAYLDQVLLHGFFHADPHAGNLAIDLHGNLVIYDFGMIGKITESQRSAITGCIAAVIKKDIDELIKHLTVLDIVRPDSNTEPLKRALTPFIDYYAGKGIKEIDFTSIEDDVDEIAGQKCLRMPPTLAYLMRTGTALEGVARTLHPNFSFVEAAKPSLKRWIMERPEQAVQVLKMMSSDSQMSIKSLWQKLVKSGNAKKGLKFLESQSSKGETDPQAAFQDEDSGSLVSKQSYQEALDEVAVLKRRVNDLETDLKNEHRNRVNLLLQTVWFLSFAALFLGASMIPIIEPFAKYFLIGNVVMVAKIIRHLVRSNKLLGESAKKESARRLRR
mgnify:CR=1 FL=1